MRDLYVQIVDETGEATPEKTVLWDEQVRWEVSPGTYQVKLTNRLYSRTVTLRVEEGQERTILVGNVPSGCFAFLFLIAGMGPYRVEAKLL